MHKLSGFTYVLPIRWERDASMRGELAEYLRVLAGWCDDVLVVDGSPDGVFADNDRAWAGHVRHVRPDPAYRCLNGKVTGVLTGLALARHERVVLADDDVRYERAALHRVVEQLCDHDLVRPQNYYCPSPWHACWDTARIVLNRALGHDFPGTLGVRRSSVWSYGGYDGDVLFENLELIRTVQANGGLIAAPRDLFVRRLPPTVAQFWGQRTREAYDDFAIPLRMTLWLSVAPLVALAAWCRRPAPLLVAAASAVGLAEVGRRRAGGAAVFAASASLLAPLWLLERGVCAWLAVLQRARFGGIRYRDVTIRVAAHRRSDCSPRRPQLPAGAAAESSR
ncbi:MAG: glycosyltransferase family 2 protein [Solirubrobacteraceae bacterium]